MVEVINSWAQKIIIVIIICTIIEMLLPEGKNKKYIKTVIGIYVVFTIISSIISKANNKTLNLSENLTLEDESRTIETSVSLDTNKYIEDVYKEKIKTDIKIKINAIDYYVKKIDLEIETEEEQTYGTILKLDLNISPKKQDEKQSDIYIEKVVIGGEKIQEANISDEEKEKIKQYLAEVYYININDINIY